ncbi:unnamed protein product [Brugia pahangi]|uniref:C2H2-type domain-containing protein n=1 Tax=Brugia pahangi TaxID=6280 RepID=A0A0N4TV47_BRUPA|nr:unnamed protein product [Brugia pahangi]
MNQLTFKTKPRNDIKWIMKLRKYGNNKLVRHGEEPISSLCITGMKNPEIFKPILLNDIMSSSSSSSSVLSFKCSFCDAYIFTLESFIIHLKSSHSNEDISEMINNHFQSCITSVEKEKVITVTYAFPQQNVDFCYNSNDDASSNSDTSLCSSKIFQNLENEMLEVTNDNATSTVTCETISIEDDSLISTDINLNLNSVRSKRWMNNCHPKYCHTILNYENEKEEMNDITNSQENAQFQENFMDEISNFLVNQTSLDETKTKVYSSNIAPTLLTDSSRRRQMSTFEKMMALTCQKCGQKFKNRC